jgi:uncharacterized protein with GYD domain
MGKYLLKVSYTPEGIKGVVKAGVYVIADVPDNATALALGATIVSSGAISSYETVVLLSAAEVDAAMQTSIDYRPPGS